MGNLRGSRLHTTWTQYAYNYFLFNLGQLSSMSAGSRQQTPYSGTKTTKISMTSIMGRNGEGTISINGNFLEHVSLFLSQCTHFLPPSISLIFYRFSLKLMSSTNETIFLGQREYFILIPQLVGYKRLGLGYQLVKINIKNVPGYKYNCSNKECSRPHIIKCQAIKEKRITNHSRTLQEKPVMRNIIQQVYKVLPFCHCDHLLYSKRAQKYIQLISSRVSQ